ncbi:substrate-binding and VWA domain-containing protein [Streptomyces sp. NPDC005727]|uniref:substrate-binding and VWA domain-containing protein n=1 Tax=Streptomyces sp. NPDC005727 TaxID=3157053 RepID=UPI0033CDE219
MAEATHYSPSALSKVTDGKKLSDTEVVQKFVTAAGVTDTGPWVGLRYQAQAAEQELRSQGPGGASSKFAADLISICTAHGITTEELGQALELAASWKASQPEPEDARPPEAEPEPESEPEDARRWRPRRSVWLAVGLVAVIITTAGLVELVPGGGAGTSCGQVTETLRIASSTDKSRVLGDLAHDYGRRSSQGQCVEIVVDSVDSGTAMQALARGWSKSDGPRPDVWSPASRIWLPIARQRAHGAALRRLPEEAGPSVVTSPLTIAMPEPMAKALGWPEKQLGWKDLAALAGQPHFWKDHGHPEWGAFKLGKTNPEYSTSGLNATIAAFYTKTGTSGELAPQDLQDADNRKRVQDIEKAAVHYGDTTLTFLANLRRADDSNQSTSYISAVTVEETAVIAYNKGYPCGSASKEHGCSRRKPPKTKLLAFYPDDGTLYSDHPYIPLNGLHPAQRAIADDFQKYLAGAHARSRFAELGFRIDPAKATAQITRDNGALPDAAPPRLDTPSADVLDKLLVAWRQLRKPANVLILMDTSGSMDEGIDKKDRLPKEPSKLDYVKAARGPLLDGFTDQDKVGLWSFSDSHKVDQPLSPLGAKPGTGRTHRDDLKTSVQHLKPQGATALNDVIDKAVKDLRHNYDANAINAVVVLTDGRNEPAATPPALEDLLSRIGDPDQPAVRVFTIAYSSSADQKPTTGPGTKLTRGETTTPLQDIADRTHARYYDAHDPRTINKVLADVFSNF